MTYKIKISLPAMSKYNNAEFSNVANRIYSSLSAIQGDENFPITEAKMLELKALCDTMAYALTYSRSMPETALVEAADKKLDKAIVYFHRAVRNECDAPNTAKAKAAQALYEKTRPYIGIQSLPYGQQVATTKAYLDTLKDEAANIETIGLTTAVDEMNTALAEFSIALDTRTFAESNTIVSKAAENRPAYCALLADILAHYYAHTLIQPTQSNQATLKNLEQIITDQENAYRLRRAKAPTPETDVETPEADTDTEEPAPEGETATPEN
jgi:hypothetical protein